VPTLNNLSDFIAKGELSMDRGLQVDRRKFLGAAAAVGAASALKSSPIKALTQKIFYHATGI